MKLQRKSNQEAGATLVEVVFSVAILAICFGALMGALANGFFGMQLTRENQRATQILMQEAEMIRLYSWDQINTPGFIPTAFTEQYDPNSNNGNYGCTYSCTVAIDAVPFAANYASNMRQLTMTVNWTTKGIARTRKLVTLVSKDGLQNYVF